MTSKNIYQKVYDVTGEDPFAWRMFFWYLVGRQDIPDSRIESILQDWTAEQS